ARRLAALEPRQARFERAIERMVAGDEARGAGAGAMTLDRGDGGRLDQAMLAQIEIIVAREAEQPAPVLLEPDAVARELDQPAAQELRIEPGQLVGGEAV